MPPSLVSFSYCFLPIALFHPFSDFPLLFNCPLPCAPFSPNFFLLYLFLLVPSFSPLPPLPFLLFPSFYYLPCSLPPVTCVLFPSFCFYSSCFIPPHSFLPNSFFCFLSFCPFMQPCSS
jgi:hypothetical protein